MDDKAIQRLSSNQKFHELVRLKNRLSWGLAIITLAMFFGYLSVVALSPAYIGRPFTSGTNLTNGIVFGLAVVIAAIVLTGIYVAIANGKIDQLTRELRKEATQ
jgi:uncharacterized membrane protein (DUF485 family)